MKLRLLILSCIMLCISCRQGTPRIKTNFKPCGIRLGDDFEDVKGCLGNLVLIDTSDDYSDYAKLNISGHDSILSGPKILLRFDGDRELIGFNAEFFAHKREIDYGQMIDMMSVYFTEIEAFYKNHGFKSEGDDTYLKMLDADSTEGKKIIRYRVEVVP